MIFYFILNSFIREQKENSNNIDEALFKKIADGDTKAFEKLYYSSERTMYAYVLSLVRDHDKALDILQETYLKIKSAAHLYKPMGKPLAWMFTVAKNIYRSNLRRESKYTRYDSKEIENSLDFSYITDRVDKIVLESALKILSQEEREIVILHAVTGLKHREIAKSLSVPLSTALSKYYRALKKLKKYLKEKGGF